MAHRGQRSPASLQRRQANHYVLGVSFYDAKKSETINVLNQSQVNDYLRHLWPEQTINPPEVERGEVLIDAYGRGSFQKIGEIVEDRQGKGTFQKNV